MSSNRQPSAEGSVLLPQVLSRRRLPVNLHDHELRLFSDELERPIPAVRLLKLSDVRISPEGLLFKRGQILNESFAFPFLRDEWKKRSVLKFFVRNYLFRKTRKLEKDAVWIVDQWSAGYFHWLTDALSKLFVVKDYLRDRILLLPAQYAHSDFVQTTLKAFDVPQLQFIEQDTVLRCRKLVLPTPVAPSGHYREDVIRGVRHQLTRHYAANAPTAPEGRIYITRERAQKRRIVNEAEVVDVLRRFRFEVIHAEDLSFADQIRIASEARYLISNHGAGLTNMLFMSPGGSVFELRHRLDRVNNCYFTLSSALNLNYFYQTCDSAKSGEDAHTADLIVNPKELEKNLTVMFTY